MATRKISSLLSKTFGTSVVSSLKGKNINLGRSSVSRYSTAIGLEEPITPPVKVNYTKLLINGEFVNSASGKTFPTRDPRTGNVIAHVAEGDEEDINRAVAAAHARLLMRDHGFDEGPWPKMTAYVKGYFSAFMDLIDKHSDELAALESWDTGKTYEQATQIELPMISRLVRYYAGWADKIHGLTVQADGPYHVQTLHEPIGVAGQIIPWNFPLLMFVWKVAPALATGNSIVLKTAEQTPLSSLYAANLLHEAGLPKGVLNVISGFGPTAGAALASHMDVDKLAFTGSTETGKIVSELAGRSNLKPVTLELGGKSPFIVCEDADIDKAVETAHFALFFNQKSKARAMRRVVGDPFKKGVEQGPQIDLEQFEKVMNYIKSGIESGATIETGGERFGDKGFYIQPTVFSNVQDNMLIAKEEIFGPVQSILKFKDISEVIKRSNATTYGLAAGVFTQNIDTANTVTRALRVGTVWVNCFDVFDAAIPFGVYCLDNYLQVKAVVTSLDNPAWL
ncbi:hypothetical protein MKW92_023135 [Papaver armeniacum]|nr:hypothetical protein MKW92_023135 [Papaver armeniacum]